MTDLVRTFHTRLDTESSILDDFGVLFGHLERKIFKDIIKSDRTIPELKKAYIANEGITARHFNAIRIQVEGKIDAVREALNTQVADKQQKIKSIEGKLKALTKKIAKEGDLKKRHKLEFEFHQRKRRHAKLSNKIIDLQRRITAPNPGICFGSQKLFDAQFDLKANGYKNQADWLVDWKNSRNNNVFCVGSKDETAGNQTCQASIASDGSISLKLRTPERLGHGKYVTFTGLRFGYGHPNICRAIAAHKFKEGSAITWRFVRDAKGWRVFATISECFTQRFSDTTHGAIGIDINADHIALAVIDLHGNPIAYKRFNTPIGLSSDQSEAVFGDICKTIVDMALSYRVPIVIEKLDFAKKKSELEVNHNKKYARMLSSLAYNQFKGMLRSRATRLGVPVIERNPAYTSLIGNVKFSERYGFSVHLSAAVAIGRRGMGLSERVPSQPRISLGNGCHVALPSPVRMSRRHVWSQWAGVAKDRKAALAGHFEAARKRRSSATRSLDPVAERSLAEDGLFLGQITSGLVGAIPPTTTSTKLFGRCKSTALFKTVDY